VRFNEEQLRELGAARHSLLDFATLRATPELLMAFAALFFCELIEVEGHYFVAEKFDPRVFDESKTRLTDLREVQRIMNQIQIRTLMQNAEVSDSLARVCAQVIASAWNEVHGPNHVVAEVHGTTLEDLSVTLVDAHE
jgi:hypothetical protein